MPANDWLAERRTEVAADRILDAAEKLFTRHDPGSVGMNEIAKAAGCSRATLYRYFENREALRNAYVARETHRLSESIDVDPTSRTHANGWSPASSRRFVWSAKVLRCQPGSRRHRGRWAPSWPSSPT